MLIVLILLLYRVLLVYVMLFIFEKFETCFIVCANCILIGCMPFWQMYTVGIVNAYRVHVHVHPYLHIVFCFPDSLGWVTTSVHNTQSLCGRKNHGTSFPDRSTTLVLVMTRWNMVGSRNGIGLVVSKLWPLHFDINLSFVGAYFYNILHIITL